MCVWSAHGVGVLHPFRRGGGGLVGLDELGGVGRLSAGRQSFTTSEGWEGVGVFLWSVGWGAALLVVMRSALFEGGRVSARVAELHALTTSASGRQWWQSFGGCRHSLRVWGSVASGGRLVVCPRCGGWGVPWWVWVAYMRTG